MNEYSFEVWFAARVITAQCPINALTVFLFDEAVGDNQHTIGTRLNSFENKFALTVRRQLQGRGNRRARR
jgi:hypothetical protein